MDVSAIMTPDPMTIPPTLGVDEALERMLDNDIRHFPVVSAERLVGVVSDRDLLELVPDVALGREGTGEPGNVGEIMAHEPATVTPEDTVITAAVELLVHRIGCLPVMTSGRLVGLVTEMDMLVAYDRMCAAGVADGALDDPPLKRLMTRVPEVIQADATPDDAARTMGARRIRHLPVIENGELLGILSERDLRRSRAPGGKTETVGALVDTAVGLGPEDKASRAAALMALAKVSALPILDDGELAGLVTITDLLDHALSSLRDTVEA